jgi:hypothetical protein
MPLKTLQIAVLGGSEDAVLVGLRNFPAHKLLLLASGEQLGQANALSESLTRTLKLVVEVVPIKDASIASMLEVVGQIIRSESGTFEDFLINVGPASKHLTSAGVAAAFGLRLLM